MVAESAGKRLCQARLKKGLTIDEAAHETRMRPDKIVALENDDYSRFASNAYAKGFLLIYSRFLEVDVSDQIRALEEPATVSIREYQYLENAPEVPTTRIRVGRTPGARPPSVIPLLVLIALFLLAGFGFYIFLYAQRLELDKTSAPTAETIAPAASPAPQTARNDSPSSQSAPDAASAPQQTAPAQGPVTSITAAAPSSNPPAAVLPVPDGAASPTGVNEVVVEPLRKTWVKIRKGSPDSEPIFEDFLYPHAPPLKLRGARFFVEVRDESAVQIRKNGHPIAYQAPGIAIQ
jgi:cytoskeletal protein RodZ